MDNENDSVSTGVGISPIIKVTGLSKLYKRKSKDIYALRDISLTINKGEFVAIVGESGSGKSTLLQIIGALDTPSKGSVVINGVETANMSEAKRTRFRRLEIGFVFQFFYLQPFLTLRQNIELPQMFRKQTGENDYVDRLAAAVGISERLNHLPRELSGGQIQRAAIARALSNNPKILLADEPTGNLDQNSANNIIQLFDKVRHEFNTTIIVVTHDARVASQADRVITLSSGVIT